MSPTVQNNNVWRQKTSFQPTIVVTYISAFWFWTDILLCFELTFFYVLNDLSKAGHSTAGEWAHQLTAASPSVQMLSFKSFSKNFWTQHWRAFLPEMIAKHLLSSEKMPVEPTTESILWRQISDLSGQFSEHSWQISVFSNDKFVGDMGHSDPTLYTTHCRPTIVVEQCSNIPRRAISKQNLLKQ
jgi:hypothetical protein